jgi:bifunctional UDP-N-acetylglucosamine pyrophosphorylase/glucosamine-1-phosphate N-acetyltransferase
MKLAALILAAGEGKRMNSALAKPLHRVCGRTMIDHVLDYVQALDPEQVCVVLGAQREALEPVLAQRPVQTVVQHEQLGTGHAVMAAAGVLAEFDGELLITCADIPLVRPETLQALQAEHRDRGAAATVLTADYADPTGYGRLVRDEQGLVRAIVEHRDADEATREIREINAGVYVFDCRKLLAALARLQPDNAQGEYYLTDVIADLVSRGETVAAYQSPDPGEVMGINDRVQLAQAESIARDRVRETLMRGGVTFIDPASSYLEAGVQVGRDSVIWPGAVLSGETTVGEGCEVGPHVIIQDSTLGEGCQILQGSAITGCRLGDRVQVGPFAHLRAGSTVDDEARVGSHTELVRTHLGAGVKDLHFSYLGDATVGPGCNIGAGVITCNYDGVAKHQTIIEAGAFIGSDAVLVAPLTIGAGAYVAAGSVINQDVPAEALGISRAPQENREEWALRRRQRQGK